MPEEDGYGAFGSGGDARRGFGDSERHLGGAASGSLPPSMASAGSRKEVGVGQRRFPAAPAQAWAGVGPSYADRRDTSSRTSIASRRRLRWRRSR